jgi:hypothetical protein
VLPPDDVAARTPAYGLVDNGWKRLDPDRFALVVSPELFHRLMPTSAIEGEPSGGARVSVMQANEFIDRLERQAGSYVKGIDFGDARPSSPKVREARGVRWRLPRDGEEVRPLGVQDPLLDGPRGERNPFRKKQLVVVVEVRNDGK